MRVLQLLLPLSVFSLAAASPNYTPKNWNYSWTLVGNVWFARLETKRTWPEQMEKCQSLEDGKSSIATIASGVEQREVYYRLARHNTVYIGTFEIGSSGNWYW